MKTRRLTSRPMPAEAGTPVVRDDGHRLDLPSRARDLVEAITWPGTSTQPQLQPETEQNRNRLEVERHLLQPPGLVLALSRDDGVSDRTTM